MAAIGSLVFCTDCGSLLEANTGRKAQILCNVCGTYNQGIFVRGPVHKVCECSHTIRLVLQSHGDDLEAVRFPINAADEAAFGCPRGL